MNELLSRVFGRLVDWVRAIVLGKLTVSVSLLLGRFLPDKQTIHLLLLGGCRPPRLLSRRCDSCRLLLLVYRESSGILLHLLGLELMFILVLEAIELIMLKQDTLLDH